MDTLKTGFIVVLLLAVLYGVYVVLNKDQTPPSAEIAWHQQQAENELQIEIGGADDGAGSASGSAATKKGSNSGNTSVVTAELSPLAENTTPLKAVPKSAPAATKKSPFSMPKIAESLPATPPATLPDLRPTAISTPHSTLPDSVSSTFPPDPPTTQPISPLPATAASSPPRPDSSLGGLAPAIVGTGLGDPDFAERHFAEPKRRFGAVATVERSGSSGNECRSNHSRKSSRGIVDAAG